MRLHRLSIHNLASLQSPTPIEIDFDEGLHGASLFAIVGQTGAGKSTILDAIQLALFGRTARLSDGQASSKSPAEIGANDTRQLISRGAKSARVRLEFSLLDGSGVARRYIAIWSCRLLAKNFESPTRTLAEYDYAEQQWSAERGGSAKKDYEDVFDRALGGMNVQEFNRTILLAQGQFAALLHANEKERVALLEQVTQTEKFRAIGARANAQHKVASAALDNARAALGALQIPADGVEDELLASIAEFDLQLSVLEQQLKELQSWILWLEKHESLVAAEAAAQTNVLEVALRRERAAEQLKRLCDAREAAEAFVVIDLIASIQRGVHQLQGDLAGIREQRIALAERATSTRAAATTAREALEQARVQRDAAALEIAEANAAWAAAKECGAQHAAAAREQQAAEQSADKAHTQLASAETTVGDAANAVAAHDALEAERSHALAVARAAAELVRGSFASLDEAQMHENQTRDAANDDKQATTVARDQLSVWQEATTEARDATNKHNAAVIESDTLSTLLAVCEATLEVERLGAESADASLELMKRIGFYVEDRAKLADGDACPLCGSREHDIDSLLHRGDAEELAANALVALEAARSRHRVADAKQREVSKAKAAADSALKSASETLAKANTHCDAATAKLAAFTAHLGQSAVELGRDALTTRIALAAERVRVAQERLAEIQKTRTALSAAESAAAQATAVRGGLVSDVAVAEASRKAAFETSVQAGEQLTQRRIALQTAIAAVEAAQARCNELLGGRNPQQVADELQHTCAVAEKAVESATTLEIQANEKLASIDAQIAQLEKQILDKRNEVEGAEAELGLLLSKSGLTREAVELRRLSAEERGTLEGLEKVLDRDEHSASGALHAASAQLATHVVSRPERLDVVTANINALRETAEQWELERATRHGERGALQSQHQTAMDARARGAEFAERVRAAELEHQAWRRLHDVIGRSDGGAFATFAQSLGLEELLWQANEQLAHLNRRYAFVRTSGLDFGIRDHEQLDELRPLSTLSGGETFLCSLALALGLARWRVSSIPIETLLLDEGFGTLDGDTLGIAMGALQRLCSSGNMRVGVVTHVEAMRERIDARIVVEKSGGGRSTVRLETGLA